MGEVEPNAACQVSLEADSNTPSVPAWGSPTHERASMAFARDEGRLKDMREQVRLMSCAEANLFPLLDGDEAWTLVEDIQRNGQREKVVLLEDLILDGRNRAVACLYLGIECAYVQFEDLGNSGTPFQFVISKNLHRRHLTESQRAMAAADSISFYLEEARTRMTAGAAVDEGAGCGKAVEQAALVFRVSPRSVESALKVVREAVPELQEQVRDGQVAVSAVAEVAEQPKEAQEQIAAGGSEVVRKEAKTARERKKRAGSKRKANREKGSSTKRGPVPRKLNEAQVLAAVRDCLKDLGVVDSKPKFEVTETGRHLVMPTERRRLAWILAALDAQAQRLVADGELKVVTALQEGS